jgi:hypothetical protein
VGEIIIIEIEKELEGRWRENGRKTTTTYV